MRSWISCVLLLLLFSFQAEGQAPSATPRLSPPPISLQHRELDSTQLSVDAGVGITVAGLTVTNIAVVTGQATPTGYSWTKASGPGVLTFNPVNQGTNVASASVAGTYNLEVDVYVGNNYRRGFRTVTFGGVTVDTPPTISTMANVSTNEDFGIPSVPFTIGDDITPPGSLTVLAVVTSGTNVLLNSGVAVNGSGASRFLTLTPRPNSNGVAVISVSVTDGNGRTTSGTVQASWAAQNDAPILANPGSQTTPEDTPKVVNLTATDVENSPLTYTFASSNPTLLPLSGISASGSGLNRTVTLTPAANQSGSATVTATVNDGAGGSDVKSWTLTVTAENDAPVLGSILDVQTTVGTPVTRGYYLNDVETSPNAVLISYQSSDTTVLPTGNIVNGGSGTNRTVTVTPAALGTSTVTVSADDGAAITLTTFAVVASSNPNTAPTITQPANQTTTEDTAKLVAVTIADNETAAANLVFSVTSLDQSLVRDQDIVLGGSGGNRTVTMTPSTNAFGTVTIFMSVTDSGGLTSEASFDLTISSVNDRPFFGGQISPKSTPEDTPLLVSFTIGDPETAAGSLTMSYQTDNSTLITGLTPGGSGASRTVNITPGSGLSGVTTIRAIVSDGALTQTNSFQIAVQSVNDPPTLGAIGAQSANEDGSTPSIALTIGDPETAASALTMAAVSDNPGLLPPTAYVFGGSGANRTLVITPAANQFGTAQVTVRVNDGTNSTPQSFTLTVTGVNDNPTISSIPNQTMSPSAGTNFSATTFISGLSSPTQMEFAPDGRLFVLQESGAIRVIKNGALLTTPFATVTTDVTGERGLLGIAFDPNFGVNGFVYVHYTATSPALHARITRFTASGDVGGSPLTIWDGDNVTNDRHNGGALHFGPVDGKLYFGIGDDVSGGSFSQSLANQFGKVMRINSDGTIPTDNPFFGTASGNNRAIYAIGLRNPWTMAFKPGTQTLYVNDVGESAWEEINNVVSGGNYGWGTCEGMFVRDTTTACTTGTLPLLAYGHGSGTSIGNSIAGAAFYNPSTVQFPAGYVGQFLYGDFTSGWIRFYNPANGSSSLLTSAAGSVVDIKVKDSDGKVYWLNRSGTVGVMEATGGSSSLTVPFTVADQETTGSSLTVTRATSNPTLLPLSGIVVSTTGNNRTVMLTPASGQSGTATVTLTVTDANSGTAQELFDLTVSGSVNTPPTITAIANQTVAKNQPTGTLTTTVSDTETPSAQLQLTAVSSNPTLLPNANIVLGGSGSSRTVVATPANNQSGTATVTMTVTDGAGLTGQTSWTLTVTASDLPPTISQPPTQSMNEDGSIQVQVTISDPDTPLASVTTSGLSSNPSLVANPVPSSGSGATRTFTITSLPNQNGSATITLSANDGTTTTQVSFALTVFASNDNPTISSIASQSTTQNTAVQVNFTVGDVESGASGVTMTGTSSAQSVVANSGISFSGTGSSRTATITPVTGGSGTTTITFVGTDPQNGSSMQSFTLTVAGPPGNGTDWYVSTSGSGSSAAGTNINTPISLATAFSGNSGRIQPGHTVHIRAGSYDGGFTTSLSGTPGNRITFRCFGNEEVFIDRNLDGGSNVLLCNGNYLDFIGINFRNRAPRVGENERGAQLYSTVGGHNRFFFCSMANLENGIAPQTKLASEGGNLYYGCVSYYSGYRSGGDNKGHNFYIQHGGNDPLVIDKSVFSYSCDNGGQFYSTDGATPMRNLTVQRSFFFMWGRMLNLPGTEGIGLTTQANTVMTGIRVTDNYFWGEPGFSSTALRTSGNSVQGNDLVVEGNNIYNGSVGVEWPSPGWASATFRNNSLYVDTVDMIRYCCVGSRTFQNNTYRGINSFSPGGNFSGYVSAVGETGSSYAAGDPGQLIVLLPFNDYPTIQHAHKAVLYVRNPAQTNPLTVDISGAGIAQGQPYRILKAINMFGGTVAGSGTFNGALVQLNMLAVPMAAPAGLPLPENSAPRADIFIVASP